MSWYVEEIAGEPDFPERYEVNETTGFTVCVVDDRACANLIAAAPELLAGCGKWVGPGAFPLADSEKFHFYAHNSRDSAGSEGFSPL